MLLISYLCKDRLGNFIREPSLVSHLPQRRIKNQGTCSLDTCLKFNKLKTSRVMLSESVKPVFHISEGKMSNVAQAQLLYLLLKGFVTKKNL